MGKLMIWKQILSFQQNRLKIVKLNSKVNQKILRINVTTKQLGPEDISVSFSGQVFKQIPSHFMADIDVKFKLKDSSKYQTLITYNIDFCHIMNNVYKDTFFKRLLESFKLYGNFSEKCPINEGIYYINDFIFDTNVFPAFLLSGNYLVLVDSYHQDNQKFKEFVYRLELNLKLTRG